MPAISRPLLIALAAAIVALVAFYATQSGRTGDDSTAAPAEAPAAPAKPEIAAEADTAAKPGTTADAGPAERPADAGVPTPVRRALAGKGKVVLFFFRPGSADDRATGRAVARLRGTPGISVFSAPIGDLFEYRAVVDGLGISQAPAVVIVAGDGSARVVQGYVDPATLAQDVADTR